MNPDRLYRQHRDDALADQAEARAYTVFVAQPFEESRRYSSRRVLGEVIVPAARAANAIAATGLRAFEDPRRVGGPQGALELAEEIILHVLRCHIFIADLTLANPNVLLELGVAFGLKPTSQIVLLLDGEPSQLPFDIRGNNVLRYDDVANRVGSIAEALVNAGTAFETEYRRHVADLRRRLSSDAIWFMRHLALHGTVNGDQTPTVFHGPGDPRLRYALAESELFRTRLVEMNHQPLTGSESFATSLTHLGCRLIHDTWSELQRPLT
jgi:hypothetical protein